MEISNGEETGSDITPDEEKSSAKSSDMNGEEDENASEEFCPRLFKFTAVNSYGSAELDNKFKDDGKPLKLNGKWAVYADSEIPDQTSHLRSLIRAFTVC